MIKKFTIDIDENQLGFGVKAYVGIIEILNQNKKFMKIFLKLQKLIELLRLQEDLI